MKRLLLSSSPLGNFYHNLTTFSSRTKYFAHSIESAGSIRQPDRYVATALENCSILIYWYFVTLSNFRGCNFEKVLAKSIFCPQIFDFVSSFTCSYSMQITENNTQVLKLKQLNGTIDDNKIVENSMYII